MKELTCVFREKNVGFALKSEDVQERQEEKLRDGKAKAEKEKT